MTDGLPEVVTGLWPRAVPVLARMHSKRLAGYAALGFDVRVARRQAQRR